MHRAIHYALVAGLVLGNYLLRKTTPNYYHDDLSRSIHRASAEPAKKRLDAWKRLHYVSTSSSEFMGRLRATIRFETLGLSQDQAQSLQRTFERVLGYLERPTFTTYYGLRTDGLHVRFNPRVGPQQIFDETRTNEELRRTAEVVWAALQNRNASNRVPSLTGICLESLSVAIERTNSASLLLGGAVKKPFTVAVEAPNPGFEPYPPSPETRVAEFSLFGKFEQEEKAGPVFFTLVWVEAEHRWTLGRLLTDRSLSLSVPF